MLLQVMSGGAGEARVGTAMLNQAERRWLGSFRAGGEKLGPGLRPQPYGRIKQRSHVRRNCSRLSHSLHFTRRCHQYSTSSSRPPPTRTHHYQNITITMDQLQISPETQQGLQNLSAKDKQELNQFVVGETQKAQIQSSMRAPSFRTKNTLCCLGNIFSHVAHGWLAPSRIHTDLS
jgi:hypothetical protein